MRLPASGVLNMGAVNLIGFVACFVALIARVAGFFFLVFDIKALGAGCRSRVFIIRLTP
jgi:hypothetical protein